MRRKILTCSEEFQLLLLGQADFDPGSIPGWRTEFSRSTREREACQFVSILQVGRLR